MKLKASQKFLQKTYLANMPKIPYAHIKRYGEYCRLEGKINSLNSFGTNNWVDKLLPKYRKQLKAMIEEDNL